MITRSKARRRAVGICCSLLLIVACASYYTSVGNRREEALRASLEKQLSARLPPGSPKEKIAVTFREMNLSADLTGDVLPYYTAEVALKRRWEIFEDHLILVSVHVDSMRSVEKVDVTIFNRTL